MKFHVYTEHQLALARDGDPSGAIADALSEPCVVVEADSVGPVRMALVNGGLDVH